MKKYLLLFASALALTACKDDDVQNYELDMLKGNWKTAKVEIISGKDNTTVLNTTVPAGCEAKNITEFRTDYYTSYMSFSGTGTTCTSSLIEGKYAYDSENKNMVISYNNNGDQSYKLTILSYSELKMMQTYDQVDFNGDMVKDFVYITYKR